MSLEMLELFYLGNEPRVITRWRNPNGSWSAERNIGGRPGGVFAAAMVPGTEVLQLFYQAIDGRVSSIWRNVDGSWSGEQILGVTVSSTEVTAIAVPGTKVLQLFYGGSDSGVGSIWRDPTGSWSAEQHLGGQVDSAVITASMVPDSEVLQLFYRGSDGGVGSIWRDPTGSWSAEQHLGGAVNAGSNITAITVPGTQILQLFYQATDGSVRSLWRNPSGSWSGEQNLGGNAISDIAASVIPGTDVVQLFYTGTDQAVWSRWRNPEGSWSTEQRLGGNVTMDSNIAPGVVPGTEILQLFYDGTNGVSSIWRNPDGSWSAEQNLGGHAVSDITAAVVPLAMGSSLFVSVYDGQQHFTYRDSTGGLQDAWWGGRVGIFNNFLREGPWSAGEYVIPTHGPEPTPGSLFVSVYNDQQHFTYRDHNSNLQDAWWGGGNWHLQQINDANGRGATVTNDTYIAGDHTLSDHNQLVKATAPAVGGLFVCPYNNQHHFAYLDDRGGIQDVWFDGNNWHLQQINAGAGVTINGEYAAGPGPAAAGTD
jgi:hypothetical protein